MAQELLSMVRDPHNLFSSGNQPEIPHPFSHKSLPSTGNRSHHKSYEPDLFEHLDSTVRGYYQVDLAGNITGFDRDMLDILGYNAEELMGLGHHFLMDTATAHMAREIINQVYRTGQSFEKLEWQLVRKDGTIRAVLISISLLKNNVGIPKGFAGVVQDDTRCKQITYRLKEEKNALRDREHRGREVQTALRVLMKNQENIEEELAERMLTLVKTSVLPHIEWLLERKLSSNARARVLLMQSHLINLMSPFARKMTSTYYNLTHTELEVADLVKFGRSNKEIAAIMGLALKTVETHRNKIRRKLGINNTKINLRAYLQRLAG